MCHTGKHILVARLWAWSIRLDKDAYKYQFIEQVLGSSRISFVSALHLILLIVPPQGPCIRRYPMPWLRLCKPKGKKVDPIEGRTPAAGLSRQLQSTSQCRCPQLQFLQVSSLKFLWPHLLSALCRSLRLRRPMLYASLEHSQYILTNIQWERMDKAKLTCNRTLQCRHIVLAKEHFKPSPYATFQVNNSETLGSNVVSISMQRWLLGRCF